MSAVRSSIRWQLSTLLLVFIAACTTATARPMELPTPTAAQSTATAIHPAPPSPTTSYPAPETLSRTQYTLSAVFDDERMRLDATEIVTYVNRSAVYMNELLFVIEPLRWEGAFQLQDIRWEDGIPVSNLGLERRCLRFPLRQSLPPGESVSVHIQFSLNLPPRAGAFGYTGRQFNFTDWYPVLPPYDPHQGWAVHSPVYLGEHMAYDIADFHVTWTFANPTHPLILAASAPAEEIDGSSHFELRSARCFSLSASDEYEIYSRESDSVQVTAFVFPEHAGAGQIAVDVATESLSLYGELFGTYPHASLAIVEADFFDGLETSALFFLDQTFFDPNTEYPANWLTTLVAHETSHQWWHTMVGNDQALEPWLDEALATYSERLYYEHLHPNWVEWWWSFRVYQFSPQGMLNGTIYDYEDFRDYVDAVYLRGSLFLEALRMRIGDPAFYAFLRDYAERGAGEVMTGEDFFQVLADHSTEDITELKGRFFDTTVE